MWFAFAIMFLLCTRSLAHPFSTAALSHLIAERQLVPGLIDEPEGAPKVPENPKITPIPISDFLSSRTASSTKTTAATTTMSTNAVHGVLTHSIIGSLPAFTSTRALSTSTPSMTDTLLPTTSITVGYTKEAPSTPPDEMTEWKVIGIAIISITFIATVILMIAFFDSWWGFLRDIFLGKKEKEAAEDMWPDTGKKGWEFKLANEDGHRYPTLASLDSLGEEKSEKKGLGGLGVLSSPYRGANIGSSPNTADGAPPHLDPHPMDPLFRRPSNRSMPDNTFPRY